MSLSEIAQQLVAPKKGILAADESTGTIKKRFDDIGVESTEETRQAYRELLFTTPEIEQYISGVILFDETIKQSTRDGVPFVNVLKEKGIIPGIKVDLGTTPLSDGSEETTTKGIDTLEERLKPYVALGAQFAKWRAVITIDEEKGLPTQEAIEDNAALLAQYARICQEQGIVPIVEPEVLMDGTHSSQTCFDVTVRVQKAVFTALEKERVDLAGMLLKPNMIVPAKESGEEMKPEVVAQMTTKCLLETVPPEVPGIIFLSGGESEVEAAANLNAMNAGGNDYPWELSFSFGRALQASVLQAWSGKDENVAQAQKEFLHRASLDSAASCGEYDVSMEK